MSNKLKRNAPCPCGSGKKVKRCCNSVNAHPERRAYDVIIVDPRAEPLAAAQLPETPVSFRDSNGHLVYQYAMNSAEAKSFSIRNAASGDRQIIRLEAHDHQLLEASSLCRCGAQSLISV